MNFFITLCPRLLLAAFCGAAIGIERSFRRKEAGIRTHTVLALAVSLFMVLSKYAFFDGQGDADPTMIACQVVMGINFLGAGIILRSKQVATHGLTTAAGVWATCAVGMTIGAGLELLGILFTLLVIGLQLLLHKLNIIGSAHSPQELRITCRDTPEIRRLLRVLKFEYNIQLLSSRQKTNKVNNTITLILQVQMPEHIGLDQAMNLLDRYKDIIEISV